MLRYLALALVTYVLPAVAEQVRITEIQTTPDGMTLGYSVPADYTNHLDVYCSTCLTAGIWVTLATDRSIEVGHSLQCALPSDTSSVRFFILGDHDLDYDSDGLPDAGEILLYHTDPADSDSDDDGVTDGAEIVRGTDPLNGQSWAKLLYADSDIGSDLNDGCSATVTGSHGPKRSLGAIGHLAIAGDRVVVSGQSPFFEPALVLGEHDLCLIPHGNIVVRP